MEIYKNEQIIETKNFWWDLIESNNIKVEDILIDEEKVLMLNNAIKELYTFKSQVYSSAKVVNSYSSIELQLPNVFLDNYPCIPTKEQPKGILVKSQDLSEYTANLYTDDILELESRRGTKKYFKKLRKDLSQLSGIEIEVKIKGWELNCKNESEESINFIGSKGTVVYLDRYRVIISFGEGLTFSYPFSVLNETLEKYKNEKV